MKVLWKSEGRTKSRSITSKTIVRVTKPHKCFVCDNDTNYFIGKYPVCNHCAYIMYGSTIDSEISRRNRTYAE